MVDAAEGEEADDEDGDPCEQEAGALRVEVVAHQELRPDHVHATLAHVIRGYSLLLLVVSKSFCIKSGLLSSWCCCMYMYRFKVSDFYREVLLYGEASQLDCCLSFLSENPVFISSVQ